VRGFAESGDDCPGCVASGRVIRETREDEMTNDKSSAGETPEGWQPPDV
jgi:hypothetical protein